MGRIERCAHQERENLALRVEASKLYGGYAEIVERQGEEIFVAENPVARFVVERIIFPSHKRYETKIKMGDREITVIIGSLSVRFPRFDLLRIYVGEPDLQKKTYLQITSEGDAFWFYPGSGVSHNTPFLTDLERFKEALYFLQQENPKSS